MNKKLKKYLDDRERMKQKILEMQEQLKAVCKEQELEENREIVKSLRGMKLDSRELFSLLCGLQDGSITFQTAESAGDIPVEKVGNGKKVSAEREDKEDETEMDENA